MQKYGRKKIYAIASNISVIDSGHPRKLIIYEASEIATHEEHRNKVRISNRL